VASRDLAIFLGLRERIRAGAGQKKGTLTSPISTAL